MLLPTNIATGRVTGQFLAGVVDGVDDDQDPDAVPAAGFVTFTASVPYLPDPTAAPNPATILTTSVVAVLDNEGYLCTPAPGTLEPSYRGVRLIATDDPDLSVEGWTWNATYSFSTVSGQKLAIPTHSFAVPSDGVVDLTTVVKVPSSAGIGTEQAEALAASAQAAAIQSAQDAATAAQAAVDAAGAAQVTDANISALVGNPATDTADAVTALVVTAAADKLNVDDAINTYQSQAALDAAAASKVNTAGTATNTAVKAIADASSGSKIPASEKGAASGVATLDADAKIPVAQVPDALKTGNGAKPVGKGELVINVKDYGAVGDGVTDDTASINAAIAAGIAAGKTVFIPSGTYVFNGYTNTGQGIAASIEGEQGNVPTLRKTQAAADAGGYMLMFNNSRYSTVSGLTLAASVKPNQQKISLTSVTGLSAGMVIQISSNRLWYNGHRGVYYCGEIHKITDVDTVAKTVTVGDFTRDLYTIGTDTLTIRAWSPNKVSIKNLRIEAPYPATNITSVGIALQQGIDVQVENVTLKGFRQSSILENLCWNSRFINVKFEQDDRFETAIGNNYGIESNGSVGTLVDGMASKGLRRAFDAGSISGTTEAAICRDWRVTNFIVRGGGSWYPNNPTELNYGIGMHGSSENGVISNGFIEDVSNGITARGRNTTVENVTFAGTLTSAISLHENGAGLIVRNCTYDSFNYPNKFTDLANVVPISGCNIFVQLGLTSGGIDANCFFDLPIIIDGNVCKGLTNSFVQIGQNGLVAKSLRVTNNHIEAIPGPAGTFNTFSAAVAGTNLTDSVFNNNRDEVVNGTVVTWGPNLVMAYRETSTIKFKVDGTHWARIPTDTVVRIPRVAKAGQRTIVLFHADAGGSGFFRLIPENASATTMGATLAATVRATATGSSLTGTTGTVGDMTFGLMNNGDLYIENRATSVYTFRLTIQ